MYSADYNDRNFQYQPIHKMQTLKWIPNVHSNSGQKYDWQLAKKPVNIEMMQEENCCIHDASMIQV